MSVIDLRSDTITKPTKAMRLAMANAKVGDDVYKEDPTVNSLEKLAAEKMGKKAALFVPSGTMANLISLMTHCNRGDEVILGDRSHIYTYEQGGSAAIGGIHSMAVTNEDDGTLKIKDIKNAIRSDNIHFPKTSLLVIENTHNQCCGAPVGKKYMDLVYKLMADHKIKIHIDGARIFNASVALNINPSELAAHADSVSFCLSKGLCCPAGSLICGSEQFIDRAVRLRKMLGGGMRQAGILAAAGIIALNEMTERVAEDHENAKKLAAGLADFSQIIIAPEKVKTNIVYFKVLEKISINKLVRHLEKEGVKINKTGINQIRAVTHYHIKSIHIDSVIKKMAKCLKKQIN